MKHLSYSELKDWVFCPWYRDIAWEQRIFKFETSIFSAFGTAIHEICGNLLSGHPENKEQLFTDKFRKCLLEAKEQPPEAVFEEFVNQGIMLLNKFEFVWKEYFGEFKLISLEEPLLESILGFDNWQFKGFVDVLIQTADGKYHIVDCKSTSWGWDAKKRSDTLVTYQLTLYKHFLAQKHGIDPDDITTHFCLLKRTAKDNNVELFRVTSGNKKTQNALNLLNSAVHNIEKGLKIKNRLNCGKCKICKTEYCP